MMWSPGERWFDVAIVRAMRHGWKWVKGSREWAILHHRTGLRIFICRDNANVTIGRTL